MSSRKISLIRSGENSTSDEHFFQGGLPPECSPGIKYEMGHLAAAYVNDWKEFGEFDIDLWVHGHTHVSYQKSIDGIPHASNPRGYPFEDTGFVSDLVLTI